MMQTTEKTQEPIHEVVHDHTETTPTKRTVAMAVDESESSQHAVEWALDNFFQEDDLVVLLNVRPYPTVPGPYGSAYLDFTGKELLISRSLVPKKVSNHSLGTQTN